jgi:serine/threonine protein kinase/Tol biopolymer transport system component
MGEVWAAEDTRLRRTIALKVLPPGAADDTRARARFEREAQAVAALNHPSIVTIHAVEDVDGIAFLTMEKVEGTPLSRRMGSPMPIDAIFQVAIPLTEAVAAAHEANILHRDLKPDNVMVTPGGGVKVLDFGLAKLRPQEPAAEPGSSETLTHEGRIVGTTAYMSPEQAEGKALGPESDVFSLGIILYQMATGRRPFSGDTAISIVSSILKDDPPPITGLNSALPPHLGRIVRRCLAKNPAHRYPTARELHRELELLKVEVDSGTLLEPVVGPRTVPRSLPFTAAALVVMTVAAVMGWLRPTGKPAPTPGAMVTQLTYYAGVETDPSLSTDGGYLAYAGPSERGDTDVFLQRVDGQNPIDLTKDSEAPDGAPAFSPDGTRIAFRSDRDGGGLFVMGATGEGVKRLTDIGYDPAWSPDGQEIVFATERVTSPVTRFQLSELHVVTVATGETRKIYAGDAVQPAWSPHGDRIAFWTAHVGQALSGQRDIGTVRPDGSDLAMATEDLPVDWRPQWTPLGDYLYFCSDRGGSMNLWRVAIDEKSGVAGEPEPFTTPSLWSGPFAVSGDGARIAYVARDERASLMEIGFDPRAGRPVPGEPSVITRGALLVSTWDVSPDGQWIAFTNTGRQEDLYLLHPDGSGLRKLTDDLHKDRGPSWIDDDRLVFYSNRNGGYELWTIQKDGSDLEPITETSGQTLWMPRVSPDGARLLAFNGEGTYIYDLARTRPLRKEDALHIGAGDGSEAVFRGSFWSPDGAWILGTSVASLSTRAALYTVEDGSIRALDPPEPGEAAVCGWLPDGRRFLATVGGSLWIVDAGTGEWTHLDAAAGTNTVQLTGDGKTLHYVETATEADIWAARLR